ncbi:DUF4142 domain-containing protein [Nostoc sp. 106C]|jgi:putative membrane protein|uniref:DUF4142 domain-containing protein n=1 Tax=Nostoc sp. 106C TaxID=1932667 RepID=UPI000A3A8331|nr:DUF4142 domain-containing protein [Nostoc sp. 106C]OUL18328.1 DUF305 domain-containing protein [Nostoc sp. RF31YmG]OUL32949.1 DUF305 domain-containing protein [Nostoc sp. 106C]
MLHHTKAFKKVIGSLLGVAAFISLPGLAQANLNTVKTSSQYILAQSTPTQSSPGSSTPNPGSTDSNTSVTTLDTDFMTKAAQSDLTEIQTSQLALQKSRNKAVRNYAQQMIQQHTASSKKLAAIAKAKNFALPTDIGPENKALLTQLQRVSGNSFNQAYMQGQTKAHQKTLAEYQRYLQQGQDQDLRGFANQISPLVAQHLQMAQKMTARH